MDIKAVVLAMSAPAASDGLDKDASPQATGLPIAGRSPQVLCAKDLRAVRVLANPLWTRAAVYWLSSTAEAFAQQLEGGALESLLPAGDAGTGLVGFAEAVTPRLLSPGFDPDEIVDKQFYIPLSNSVPGRDDEYNRWYSEVHLPDVVDVPGFLAAQRFRFIDHAGIGHNPFRYAAIYEIRASVADMAFQELAARMGNGTMEISTSISRDDLSGVVFA